MASSIAIYKASLSFSGSSQSGNKSMSKLSKRITSSAMNFGKFLSLIAFMMTVISSISQPSLFILPEALSTDLTALIPKS